MSDNISCFCSPLYFSQHNFPSPLPFSVTSPVPLPSSSCWLSPLYNTDAISLFTIDNPILSHNTISQHTTLHTRFISSIQHNTTLSLDINNAIVDPTFTVPEPLLISDNNIFDGWFSITFPGSHHTTHVRSPHRPRFCSYIAYSSLLLYNLYSYHHSLLST